MGRSCTERKASIIIYCYGIGNNYIVAGTYIIINLSLVGSRGCRAYMYCRACSYLTATLPPANRVIRSSRRCKPPGFGCCYCPNTGITSGRCTTNRTIRIWDADTCPISIPGCAIGFSKYIRFYYVGAFV